MIAKLYHTRPPEGRALLVAKAMHEASPKLGSDTVRLAEALFACSHPKEKAVLVTIDVPAKFAALEEECARCGIVASVDATAESTR